MNQEQMEQLMSMSLEEKIEHSKKIIKEAVDKYGSENIAVAWTGGKDSTTMVWLFREACRELGSHTHNALSKHGIWPAGPDMQ